MNSLKLTNRFPSVFANPFVSTSRRGLWRSLIWIVSEIVTWHYPFCTVILSQGKGYCVTVIGGILVRLKKLENYISAELGWNICYILSCHLKISELLTVCFHEKRIPILIRHKQYCSFKYLLLFFRQNNLFAGKD